MTTIIGLASSTGQKSIVLASDITATVTNFDNRGDVIIRKQQKVNSQKLHVSPDNEFVVGMSGSYDDKYLMFLGDLFKNPSYVREAIKTGFFPQFRNLNDSRWDYKRPTDDVNGILLGTRFNGEPKLYTCWPLGKVEERVMTSIGSGSDYAIPFIEQTLLKQAVSIYSLNVAQCIHLAVGGLDFASQDMYTGGLDFVVVTPEGIKPFGKEIREALQKTKTQLIDKIAKAYIPTK